MATHPRAKLIDVPTLIAVAIVAWALVDILHEIVGHGGAAVLLGIDVKAVSTTTVSIAWDQIENRGEDRFLNAAGALVNLLTGALALIALRRCNVMGGPWRCFLWLFASFSAIVVAMNLVSAPLIGGGDWTEVLKELEPRGVWKAGVIGAGVLLAVVGYILPLRLFMPRLKGYRLVQLGLTAIPVLTLVIVHSLSLLRSPFAKLPPDSNHLLASVFAYLHCVLWVILVNVIWWPRSAEPAESVRLVRSGAWLIVGLIILVFYVAILGPGIGSFEGDPRLL